MIKLVITIKENEEKKSTEIIREFKKSKDTYAEKQALEFIDSLLQNAQAFTKHLNTNVFEEDNEIKKEGI